MTMLKEKKIFFCLSTHTLRLSGKAKENGTDQESPFTFTAFFCQAGSITVACTSTLLYSTFIKLSASAVKDPGILVYTKLNTFELCALAAKMTNGILAALGQQVKRQSFSTPHW